MPKLSFPALRLWQKILLAVAAALVGLFGFAVWYLDTRVAADR